MLLTLGLLLVAAGVMIPILTNDILSDTFRYIYASGAAMTLLARLVQPEAPANTPVRLRRLLRLESWSALVFCVAAFFAFYSAPVLRDWIAFTIAGAIIQIYCSIAIALLLRKK